MNMLEFFVIIKNIHWRHPNKGGAHEIANNIENNNNNSNKLILQVMNEVTTMKGDQQNHQGPMPYQNFLTLTERCSA